MKRYFTVAAANATLPELEPLARELQESHALIMRLRPRIRRVLENNDSGSPDASRMVLLFMRLERTLERINALGIEVKDVSSGLCDFPAVHEGREILLCWQLGEAEVAYWHELHTGFAGRRPVEELDE